MICPNLKCGRTVVAPDSARGKVVRCVHCNSTFIVPQSRTGELPAQPPADEATANETPKK